MANKSYFSRETNKIVAGGSLVAWLSSYHYTNREDDKKLSTNRYYRFFSGSYGYREAIGKYFCINSSFGFR